jgi:copper(I)-binding protein
MLRELMQKLDAGTTVPLTLVFERAGEVTLDVPVKGMAAGMSHSGSTGGDHQTHQ